MTIIFDFLPAGTGDSILIQLDNFCILVDSGDRSSYKKIKDCLLKNLNNKRINLIILTHIDDDHIGSMKKLLNDEDFLRLLHEDCNIWMNYPNGKETLFPAINKSASISYGGGDLIKKLALNKKIKHIDNIYINEYSKKIDLTPELSLVLLSPTKENLDDLHKKWQKSSNLEISGKKNISDYHITLTELNDEKDYEDYWIPNSSSIAFLLKYKDSNKFLFLADAYARTITKSLRDLGYSEANPIKVDFIKISHHGSRSNNTKDLFNLIDCNKFIFLTNSKNFLPHKKTLARICNRIKRDTLQDILYFNYEEPIEKIENDLCIKSCHMKFIFINKLIYGN